MFSKRKKKPFDLFLEEAKKLTDEMYNLQKRIEAADQFDQKAEFNAIYSVHYKKFINESLEKKPFLLSEDQQYKWRKETEEKIAELQALEITIKRDILFDRFRKYHYDLITFCASAQNQLIQTIELKEKAHNRPVFFRSGNLKKRIAHITDEDLVKLFEVIRNSFKELASLAEFLHGTVADYPLASLHHVPREIAQMMYNLKAALLVNNDHYQDFQKMAETANNLKATENFKQFMDGTPDSRHFSKELINQVSPLLQEIEKSYQQAIQYLQKTVEQIEKDKFGILNDIMTMPASKPNP